MIKLTQLSYQYDNLNMFFDFAIEAGERVAVMGPSGAGKSTLLSLISGFQFPLNGTTQLNGTNHTFSPPAKRPVSMLFQENNLFAHLTVRQNIGLGLQPSLRLKKEQMAQVELIAQQVSLTDLLERLPSQLSGGQRQRAALARCLIRNQPILLLDEPFSALDPALRNEMLQLLNDICKTKQITLLMVSHNIEDALQIAPRTLVIADGLIAYDGSTLQLLEGQNSASKLLGISVSAHK
ncbi:MULTISPECIES: thiamine ABC transporter ATP-binding protein ThiQ [Providencia]|uniref:ATP-binding component of an ABC superfamily thiamine transporter n=1 Tax=Providencia heimbachae ATCC 35613 TaxID=1354272 RepID=A0A1B7JZ15_9GAMM|nr:MULTISPECIES: thiamine ABC transporter ATP-binding protein ThiQ [Providencia]MBP6123214.1 thiamine ABC transporter ATP-binding protein ThiQ [Providencia sp.]MDD9339114.1 thiamine ABC transporter ATP-binding protein ThiQ [Providencia heimbachae]NIH23751.1 thiamine ABC transporter ATP-binding protein ThiQ [Providencia heimbachae]OAT53115.1 ATP-binding component of an ABC superfamily thiamine transporter [Providencia heimbachae ATCC 35613]QCJ71199.1 thiamine ABC transporter ATP-binding protein